MRLRHRHLDTGWIFLVMPALFLGLSFDVASAKEPEPFFLLSFAAITPRTPVRASTCTPCHATSAHQEHEQQPLNATLCLRRR
jgi:hypothetical protein